MPDFLRYRTTIESHNIRRVSFLAKKPTQNAANEVVGGTAKHRVRPGRRQRQAAKSKLPTFERFALNINFGLEAVIRCNMLQRPL